jgi:ABC-2 type transport system permease protein
MTAVLVFAHRAAIKVRRVPEQAADAVLIPVIFTVLFNYVFGGALAGSTHHYLQYLLPGTLVLTVLLITVFAGASVNADKTQGLLDRYRAMPFWRPALIVGTLLGEAVRCVVAATIVIALGLILGFRPAGGVTGLVAAAALVVVFSLSLGWMWTALGLLLRTAAAVSTLSFVVQFPLVFTSNVFVDPDTMPSGLRAFVEANPVSLLATTVRHLMAGTANAGEVLGVLLAAAAVTALFAPVTLRLYEKAA